jgi:serine/threonine protein kinase
VSDDDPKRGRPHDTADSPAGTAGDFDRDQTFATGAAAKPADSPALRSRAFKQVRSFADGEVIAGRYTVTRFLAAGGMGEVYEVDDRALGERVALKTILPEIAADPTALERFRRETLLARKVTHPNVCRIFDIGHHQPEGAGDGEEVTFLTMELLGGETLAARLKRGRVPPEEALPLVRQIAAGLGAAHRAGVVHRDLKPANVFLVPERDGVRAVITDFGLARTDAAGKALADMTGTGEVLGTPAYMAPEQLEGKVPTPATDIYALGLVLYEMVTGQRAFVGDTLFQIAIQRLQGEPTAPSVHLPGLDPLWEYTILRCL